MADLPEVAQWGAEEDGIYQLELEDFITGGAGGNDNEPHRILGNRTRFLKQKLLDVASATYGVYSRGTGWESLGVTTADVTYNVGAKVSGSADIDTYFQTHPDLGLGYLTALKAGTFDFRLKTYYQERTNNQRLHIEIVDVNSNPKYTVWSQCSANTNTAVQFVSEIVTLDVGDKIYYLTNAPYSPITVYCDGVPSVFEHTHLTIVKIGD